MNSFKLSSNKIICAALYLFTLNHNFGQIRTVKSGRAASRSFKIIFLSLSAIIFTLFAAVSPLRIVTSQTKAAAELVGLWEAKRRFGPDVRGTLLLRRTGEKWLAEIAGQFASAKMTGDSISFDLPNDKGRFNGKFDVRRTRIVGHWIQPAGVEIGALASPVILTKFGRDQWRGDIVPLDDALTFYLLIKSREDGSVAAFLRNPERNLGWFRYRIDRVEREGNTVKFFAANKDGEKGRLIAEGVYLNETLTINTPLRGGSYDFKRLDANEESDFYPRKRPNENYRYASPPQLDDGWQSASLEDVGISRTAIEKFIQMIIDTPIDSVNAQEDHGVLIARHGKLVLEEYFHGENRDKPHDTRSASKSIASDLIGAAINSGVPVSTSNYIYKIMNDGKFPSDLEPRKQALTLEHLLTMSSGYDCDESDSDTAGYEDNMWDQTEQPDFYKWTLALKMARAPGEISAYCSANANLAGGVLARVAGEATLTLFRKLIAEPMQIRRYYLPLSPAGDYSITGSARFLPRDFMKLGQVHLNNGVWNNRRIYTKDWSNRATSPHTEIGKLKYGYLWWLKDYEYNGRNIRAYFASGMGGQIVMAIPELDLVMAFYAGSYNDVGGFKATNVYVPQYILRAITK